MPVTLLTGPINAGKTSRVLDLLCGCDPGVTGAVIVPDRAAAADLRRLFSGRSKVRLHAMRSDAIEDWASFVRRLARPALPVVTRRHSALIVLGILDSIRLDHFGKAACSYATAEGFARTMLRLKENLVGPDELSETLSGLGEPRLRERDLLKVYEAYGRELSRLELLDEADLTLLAIANAGEALAGMEAIAFDEFAMPSPAQLAMVRVLGKECPDAQIVVTCPTAHGTEEKPFAGWLGRARETWLAVCDDEEELPPRRHRKTKVSVLRSSSPSQEARHAALMASKAKADGEDIVVAFRPGDSFLEWYLSEAHSMELLPEHPTLDGARGSPFAHGLISPETIDRLPKAAKIADYAERLIALTDVKGRSRVWIRGLKERRGHGRVAARSLTAAAIVEETLRALSASASLMRSSRITRDQFAQLLSEELALRTASSTAVESVLPFRLHALGTPLASGAGRLICTRMTEGSFPTRSGETLFFGDWKEESIRRIFPDAEDTHSRESYAFETMIRKCAGEVTLIMPAVGDAGGETIPSPFAERFLEGSPPESLRPCILDRTGMGRRRGDIEAAFRVESARAEGFVPDDPALGSYMGVLRSKESRRAVRDRFTEGELAPTSLERYANCPFSFFARDVLRVEETPEETPQVRGLDRGKMVHEVLTRYYRDSRAGTRDSELGTRKKIEKLIKQIVEEVWEENAGALDYVSAGLRARETEEIARMALAVVLVEAAELEHLSSPLRPREFEWEFGRDRGNGLSIPVEGDAPLLVRGRVDRIDVDSDGSRFLVIDYKSGGADQVVGRIESGEHLQLPLYIDAVGRSLYPDALALGGLLLVIKDIEEGEVGGKTPGKTKGLVLKEFEGACYRMGRSHAAIDVERMELLIGAARARAAEFASKIRKGLFSASSEAECRNCDYGDICRHRGLPAD